ncbi:MAG: TetR/AcrR family transcriptional regulator [Vicinamibacterales bacterium]
MNGASKRVSALQQPRRRLGRLPRATREEGPRTALVRTTGRLGDGNAPGPRARQKALTRQEILSAAKRLFRQHGFGETRTADIAAAARVAHGSVFVHFPSRDMLVDEAIRELATELTDAVDAAARARRTLRGVLAAHGETIAPSERLYVALLLESVGRSASRRTAWLGMQSAVSSHIARAMTHTADAIGPRVSPAFVFNLWLGMLHHYLLNRDVFAPGRSVLHARGRELVEAFVSLVTAGDEAKAS